MRRGRRRVTLVVRCFLPAPSLEEVVVRYMLCCACVGLLALGSARAQAEDKEAKLSAAEQMVVDQVNKARKEARLPPVKPNAALCACARAHAAAMARKGKLQQSFDGKLPADQARAAGYDAGYCASLVVQGGKDLGPVFKQLLGEKTCRQELQRRDVREVGVGIAADGKGQIYYNIVLAKPK